MAERDKPNLDEVHEREPDQFSDRQNLEGGPSSLEQEPDTEEFEEELEEVNLEDDDDDEELDVYDSESDIEEFAPDGTEDDPSEDEAPRTHDDDDPWGDGVHDTPLNKRYEDMADRDELARRVEELVADAYDWAGSSEDEDAQRIYDDLVGLAERIGNPPEDTTRTEAGEPPEDSQRADDLP